MILSTLLLVYITSGVIMSIENDDLTVEDNIPFHVWIYFTVVTFSTVGYGDFTPVTGFGRMFITGIIVFMIIMIPKQTNELLRLMSMQSVYQRNNYKAISDTIHLVVTGDVMLPSLINFT